MRALFQNTQFMRLFLGRLITNAGDSLYYIAAMWLVYDLTGSAFFTGIAGFLSMGPSAIQFAFGPLVDRLPIRRVLVGTQFLQATLVLAIPAAAALGVLSVWVVLVVMPLLSLLNQPVYPAESAALPRIVDQEELVAANSLFSVAYQGVDAVFNGVAGLLVAAIGAVSLFLVDSVTFAIALLLFATLRIPEVGAGDTAGTHPPDQDAAEGERSSDHPDGQTPVADGGETPKSYLDDLREGLGFLRGTIVVKLMMGAVVVNFAFGGVMAVLPAYAAGLGGAGTYGILTAAVSGGLLVGAVAGNAVKRFPFGRVMIIGLTVGAGVWMTALLIGWFPASAVLFGLALLPAGVTNVMIVSLVQSLVPDDLLGRVSSVLGSASTVMTPVGALAGGGLAEVTSAAVVMWVAGGGLAFIALYVFAVPELRRLPRVEEVTTLSMD